MHCMGLKLTTYCSTIYLFEKKISNTQFELRNKKYLHITDKKEIISRMYDYFD